MLMLHIDGLGKCWQLPSQEMMPRVRHCSHEVHLLGPLYAANWRWGAWNFWLRNRWSCLLLCADIRWICQGDLFKLHSIASQISVKFHWLSDIFWLLNLWQSDFVVHCFKCCFVVPWNSPFWSSTEILHAPSCLHPEQPQVFLVDLTWLDN